MGGRFGKYGDVKRKAKIRKSKIGPKVLDKIKNVPRKNRKPRPASK